MIKVRKYLSTDKDIWDDFIEDSKNATFLFKRDFMEYHKDRFKDYSLLIFSDNKLIGLLPACQNEVDTITSHSGLTYGGLIVSKDIKLINYLECFISLLEFLTKEKIKTLIYKSLPNFYTTYPSQEEEYALFILEAKIIRTDTSITIDNQCPLPYQTRRKRSIKKALKNSFIVKEDNDFELFWNTILIPNLKKRFGKSPVHTRKEIEYLAAKFPRNIFQINIYNSDELIAGCTVFETKTTAHAQYISANDYGRSSGALDQLFDFLIKEKYKKKKFFDFGICNENNGEYINKGLLEWKEGFGGRTNVHKFYSIDTSNAALLNKLILND